MKEITIPAYVCDFCAKRFTDKDKCIEHESTYCENNNSLDWELYRFKKYFRGGRKSYFIKIRPSLMKEYGYNMEDLCRIVGEETDGGESYGWNVNVEKVDDYPEGEKTEDGDYWETCNFMEDFFLW